MADAKISALPEATALTGVELILASQSAADVRAMLRRLKDELDWVRPADWPAMPASVANTVHILAAVHDHASNLAAVRMSTSSGTWSIDWGDGTATNGVASGATAEHTYDYLDGDLSALTARGYKTAMITITADSGNLTIFNPSIAPTGTSNHCPPWLEMQINMPAATVFTTLQNACIPRLCEHINFVATGNVTALAFGSMSRLERISHHNAFFSHLTSMHSVFVNCANLRRVDLTNLSTSITSMQSAFQGCVSITELAFPAGSLGSSLTGAVNMCLGCASLSAVTLPAGAFSHVTNAGSAFSSCPNLREMVFPTGALAAATTVNGLFATCSSLRYVEFASALAAVTDMASMFNNCNALQAVKFASGGFGSLSSATTNLFNGCNALARVENCSIPLTFSLANCRLSAAALDEIYTALPTISSQTITVSGNYGTSGDTPSIATGKGWAVTG